MVEEAQKQMQALEMESTEATDTLSTDAVADRKRPHEDTDESEGSDEGKNERSVASTPYKRQKRKRAPRGGKKVAQQDMIDFVPTGGSFDQTAVSVENANDAECHEEIHEAKQNPGPALSVNRNAGGSSQIRVSFGGEHSKIQFKEPEKDDIPSQFKIGSGLCLRLASLPSSVSSFTDLSTFICRHPYQRYSSRPEQARRVP